MECKLNTPYGLSNPNKTSNKTIDWFNLADKDKDGILSVMEVLQISDLKQAKYLNRTQKAPSAGRKLEEAQRNPLNMKTMSLKEKKQLKLAMQNREKDAESRKVYRERKAYY